MGSNGLRERLRAAEARADRAESANRALAASLTAAHAEAIGATHSVRLEQLPPTRRRLVEDIRAVRQWAEHLEREVARLGGTETLPAIPPADEVDTVTDGEGLVVKTYRPNGGPEQTERTA